MLTYLLKLNDRKDIKKQHWWWAVYTSANHSHVETLHFFMLLLFPLYLVTMLCPWLRQKNHLVKVRKRSCLVFFVFCHIVPTSCYKYLVFGSRLSQCLFRNVWFCWHGHGWKMSRNVVKNIQWFHTYKCWHGVSNSGLSPTQSPR